MDFNVNVNVNVKLDATPALTSVVSTLAGVLTPAVVSQPTITVPVIAEPITPATDAPTVSTVSPEQGGNNATKSGEITDEQLRTFIGPKSKEKGKEAIFAILDEFGVKRVPDLKQEQRQEFIDKVNAL